MKRMILAAAALCALPMISMADDDEAAEGAEMGLAGLLSATNRAELPPLTLSAGQPIAAAPLKLKSGTYYTLEIEADGSQELALEGAGFFRAIWVNEVVIEGTADEVPREDGDWREYEFHGKPGDPRRWPRQFAPYHLRLDWLMWFAGISPAYARSWFLPFVVKLLENDRATLRLLRRNPFPDAPPAHVRALLYRYRFTDLRRLRETGAWWERSLVREYLPPVSRRTAGA